LNYKTPETNMFSCCNFPNKPVIQRNLKPEIDLWYSTMYELK